MLKKIYLAAIALALGAGLTAAAAATARPAIASTPGCTGGAWTGYCGTQTDQSSPALSFDVYKRAAAVGNKIIAWPDSDNDPAVDFVAVAYDGGTAKMFIYAPYGVPDNLCIAELAKGTGLVLRTCDGSGWQLWTAAKPGSGAGYTWTNKATGDIIQDNGQDQQLTGVTPPAPPALPAAQQLWTMSS